MANIFSYSIGRKLVMSVSGLFLILFLLVHLLINSFLILDPLFGTAEGELYNIGVDFMTTNPLIKVMEPVLAAGFVVHILFSIVLTIQNRRARGSSSYDSGNKADVEWTSKNMFVLGLALLAFMVIHIAQFFVKIKITGDPLLNPDIAGHNSYALVHAAFQITWVMILYVIGGIALAFHLSHGFWSAFHSVGLSNTIWIPRLKKISIIVAWFIGLGFSFIALVQYLFFPLS